jgi:uncharacterized protein (TIRG00374 family)
MKKRLALGIVVGLVCLWLALRNVSWPLLRETLLGVRYPLLLLVLLAQATGMTIRVIRWRLLVDHLKPRTSWRSLSSATAIGFMANFVLPGRVGEFIRAWVLGRREGIPVSASFATIVVERLFDGFAVLLFLGLSPFLLRVSAEHRDAIGALRAIGLGVLGAYSVALAFLLIHAHRPVVTTRLAVFACRPLPPRMRRGALDLLDSFGRGLSLLARPWQVVAAILWSMALWTSVALGNLVLLAAFGLRTPIFAGFFLVVAQAFGVAVPSPGGAGSLQYAHVVGLAPFGIPADQAAAVGILFNALLLFFFIGLGLVFLKLEGLDLGVLADTSRDADPAGGESGNTLKKNHPGLE